MGLLDRFKSKPQTKEVVTPPVVNNQPTIRIDPFTGQDGMAYTEVNYHDVMSTQNQNYDTTRLVLRNAPIKINGKDVYEAFVAWYGSSDAIRLDGGREMGRRADYKSIHLGVDLEKLYSDPEYQKALFIGLLNRQRVEKYRDNGLDEYARQPSGDYVGEIMPSPNGSYGKVFDASIGRAIHNSRGEQMRRSQHREALEARKNRELNELREQRAGIDSSIRNLENPDPFER